MASDPCLAPIPAQPLPQPSPTIPSGSASLVPTDSRALMAPPLPRGKAMKYRCQTPLRADEFDLRPELLRRREALPLSTAKRRRKPACTASFPSYDGASVHILASSSSRETDHRLSFGCRTGRAQGSLGYVQTMRDLSRLDQGKRGFGGRAQRTER